jgi:predicted phage-related endonuclease
MIQRTPIESETQWLDLRRQNVGASEVAALLGSHPYLSAYGLAAAGFGRPPFHLDRSYD